MPTGSTLFRLGLCLVVIGGFVGLIAFPTWSSLNSSLQGCWDPSPPSSCTSIALSTGFWIPITIGSLLLLAAGLVVTIVGLRTGRFHGPIAG